MKYWLIGYRRTEPVAFNGRQRRELGRPSPGGGGSPKVQTGMMGNTLDRRIGDR